MNNLFRTTWVELKANFTISRIIGILVVVLIPLLGPLISGDIKAHGGKMEDATWSSLGSVLSQGVIYSLGLRMIFLLKDGSTLDKNRTLFLTMDKKQVLFGKVFSDVLLFLLSIALVSILGPILVIYKNHGKLASGVILRIAIYSIAISILYVLISVGSRYIVARFRNIKKWIIFGTFVTLTATFYIVMSIVVGVVDDVEPIFDDNKMYLMFIPFLNITYIPMALYGFAPLWTIIPFVVEVAIFVIVIWKPMSTSVKEYLCG